MRIDVPRGACRRAVRKWRARARIRTRARRAVAHVQRLRHAGRRPFQRGQCGLHLLDLQAPRSGVQQPLERRGGQPDRRAGDRRPRPAPHRGPAGDRRAELRRHLQAPRGMGQRQLPVHAGPERSPRPHGAADLHGGRFAKGRLRQFLGAAAGRGLQPRPGDHQRWHRRRLSHAGRRRERHLPVHRGAVGQPVSGYRRQSRRDGGGARRGRARRHLRTGLRDRAAQSSAGRESRYRSSNSSSTGSASSVPRARRSRTGTASAIAASRLPASAQATIPVPGS